MFIHGHHIKEPYSHHSQFSLASLYAVWTNPTRDFSVCVSRMCRATEEIFRTVTKHMVYVCYIDQE